LATGIEAQVKALPFPPMLRFSLDHLSNLGNLFSPLAGAAPDGDMALAAATVTNKLELRIHRVKCLDETNPEFWGDDEIYLAGNTVDETGDVHRVAQFKVGDFDDRDVKTYTPPRRFTWFSLNEGPTWPKRYATTLILTEKDWGGLADFLDKLYRKVREKIVEAIQNAVEKPIESRELAAAIATALGWIMDKLVDWMRAWLGDDVFTPVTVAMTVGSFNSRFAGNRLDSPESTATFRGHGGKYEVTYDWRLFA
jgi:hypothetical protein